jgi:hypothetical protein
VSGTKLVGLIILWVVTICLFTGILLWGGVKWFNTGGHPILVAIVVGVILVVITGFVSARKSTEADAEADREANEDPSDLL